MSLKLQIKKFLVRNFYRFINPFRRLYWRAVKPKTTGVKCLIKSGDKFLLVRNSYGKMWWTTPGGRVNKNEDTMLAACREVFEEAGIKIENPVLIGRYDNIIEHKRDTVFCYYKEVGSLNFQIDQIEISEAGWFPLEQFPAGHSSSVDKIIEMYKKYVKS